MKLSLLEFIYLIISVILIGYGYWGAFAESGNLMYDEMAGMTPWIFGIVPGVLILTIILGYRAYLFVADFL